MTTEEMKKQVEELAQTFYDTRFELIGSYEADIKTSYMHGYLDGIESQQKQMEKVTALLTKTMKMIDGIFGEEK